MSLADYAVGVCWLGAVVGALGFGAVRVRRRALGRFTGSTARLAEVTMALGAFVLVPELLGAVGVFRRVPVLLALVGVGVGAGLLAGSAPDRAGSAPEPEDEAPGPASGPMGRVVTTVAGVLAAAVFAQWAGQVVATYVASSAGIWDGDSLWYHLPFATAFVQTGWVTRPLFTNADTLVTYFPANGEVVLGLVLMPFRRDIVVPVVNLGWLAMAFLAAWSLGKRYGAPAVALAGTAVGLSVPVMAVTQAGTARNDMMGVALFLTACALLAHSRWERNGLLVAGTAAGLTLGVKLSTLIPAALLVVAVLVAAPSGRRRLVWWSWSLPVVAFGAFWYVRNLVLVGNPVPTVAIRLGPFELPSVFAESVADTAVIDRLREPGAIDRVLRPGVRDGFADLWWVLLLAVVIVAVVVLLRPPDRVARLLAAVVVAGGVAYVVMPNGSPAGDTDLAGPNFTLNLRYAMPAMVLGLALAAALPAMRDPRRALVPVGVYAVVGVVTITDRTFADHYEWLTTASQRAVGWALVVLAGLLLGATAFLLRRASRGRVLVAVAVGVVVVVAAGFVVQDEYLERRYRTPRDPVPVSAFWRWADGQAATRIGVVGTIVQYPFAGSNLAHTVRYVGVPRDDGGFRPARTCRELRERLRDGRFRYLVTTVDFFGSNVREIEKVNEWTRTIDGARIVRREGSATLYELSSPVDPSACP